MLVLFFKTLKKALGLLWAVAVFALPGSAQSNLNVYSINNVIYVDGSRYPTIAQAIAACTSACIVDSRGHQENISNTIVFPNLPVVLLLGPYIYVGPSSGSVFLINSYLSNGSEIIGAGVTASNNSNPIPVTVIQAHSGNSSSIISLGEPNQSGIVQGLQIRNIKIDGNGAASNGVSLDSVQHSIFEDIDIANTTGAAINALVNGTVANNGVQFNRFGHISSSGVAQVLLADSNSALSSDFTQNFAYDWSVNFTGMSGPEIELRGADSNWFYGLKIFRDGGAAYDVQFDQPVSNHVGGLSNEFYGLHGNPSNVVNSQSRATGNTIYGYSTIENQACPTISTPGSLTYHQTGEVGTPNCIYGAVGSTPVLTGIESFNNQASIPSSVIYTAPTSVSTMYRLTYYLEIAQSASTSSNIQVNFSWNDGFSQSFSTFPDTSNAAGHITSGSAIVDSIAASNISYSTTYTSSGATPMTYHLHLRLEAM